MPASCRPEILAPAGDLACLRAAVRAGADAVYFGLPEFSARARATNFEKAQLGETMAELHASGVSGYVALNTLVFDSEFAAAEAAIEACVDARVDALIVQDLGIMRLARAIAPEIALHASTQMTVTDAASAEVARSLGADRVVVARELSIEEIAAIRSEVDVDLEVFVHGALCIAYSGQCLTSEAIGGRSANRGACAQACRLPYELVVDGVVRDLGERAFLLSPEDLEATDSVPDLARIGVRSLKIEGRLKGEAYVAATTALYRRVVDDLHGVDHLGGPDAVALRRSALQAFSRGSGPGFLGGVNHQRLVEGRSCDHRGLLIGRSVGGRRERGRDWLRIALDADIGRGDGLLVEGGWGSEGEIGGHIWAILAGDAETERALSGQTVDVWLGPDRPVAGVTSGRRVFRTRDPANDRMIAEGARRATRRIGLAMRLIGRVGERFTLEGTCSRGRLARVESDALVEAARTTPTSFDTLREKLGRLGDTPFVMEGLEVDLPPGAMIAMSALNRARRALVDALTDAAGPMQSAHHRVDQTAHDLSAFSIEKPVRPDISASLSSGSPLRKAAAQPAACAELPSRSPPSPGLFVLCRSAVQAHAALAAGADGVVLDFLELTGIGPALRALRAQTPSKGAARATLAVAPPRIRKPGEQKIDDYLLTLEPDAILVRSLGSAFGKRTGKGPPRIGDFSLNVTNVLAALEVLARGLSAFTPAFDLDAAQLLGLASTRVGPFAEVVIHHRMPLFHMEHCVFAALLSEGRDHRTCGRPCEAHAVSLRDRAAMDHPVIADVGCRNTVFHAAAQSASGLVPNLRSAGVRRFRIELVGEAEEDVLRLVPLYRALIEGRTSPAGARRDLAGLAKAGGYGVVSGSLRTL